MRISTNTTSEVTTETPPACARGFAAMTSFAGIKRENTCRPSGYRTPSPPRHAVEPLSPASGGASALWPSHNGNWVGTGADGYKERHVADETETEDDDDEVVGVPTMEEPRMFSGPQSHNRSPSTMDAFATIALASSPTFSKSLAHTSSLSTLSTSIPWQHHPDYTSERPPKRARSEKLASPDWHRTDQRPATSHATTTDMESDAELLLYLARQPIRSPVTTLSTTAHVEQRPQGPHTADQSVIASHKSQDGHTSQELPSPNEGYANVAKIDFGDNQVDAELQHLPAYVSVPGRRSGSPVVPYHHGSEKDQLNTIMDLVDEALIRKGHGDDASAEPGEISLPGTATNELEKAESPQVEALALTQMDSNSLNHGPSITEVTIGPHQTDPAVDDLCRSPGPPPAALGTKAPNSQNGAHAICGICHFARNSLAADVDSDATSWISCDGCKRWFHFACAGFKSEREVRSVDKYSCKECKPTHGPTTFVRKSSRAHTAIDYAGLNEGVVKTSDDNPEHHYIRPIKEGTIKFLPDNFARMRPELVTAEFFEKGDGMKEPVVIPAWMNPQPPDSDPSSTFAADAPAAEVPEDGLPMYPGNVVDDWFSRDYQYQYVLNDGQDALDMVIPKNLTVRRVGELYGPEEKVEVIDVKSQEGEDKKWNMRRWVDYYESTGSKKVRNVISLEVSQSKLGRLIKRPRIVRELDLQDSVWPADLQAKGDFPKVQFYCLMSVADCYTDFHIDFGGSSVFYHILKGKKTFLFIPPREKHLKKYEEWCMSQAQNWTFLADQTKECYRVDLSEGDTMLIPSGWIHAVWTPENSLVIGGNFLTRMHYGMQIRIAQIEKATKVARKFRYPHFQKLLWYTAIRYLDRDPIPASVVNSFHDGQKFFREIPSYYEFDQGVKKAKPGDEDYHARYYSQYELEGLPDLARYLLRTALISMGKIADGITADTRNAVKRSIPKGHGDPLDIVKKFAMWSAWKRGNELIPHWAHPDAVPGDGVIEPTDKKPSAAALRRLEREAAIAAYRIAPERQSARKLSQMERVSSDVVKSPAIDGESNADSPAPGPSTLPSMQTPTSLTNGSPSTRRRSSRNGVKGSVLGPKRVACDKCRKRRIRCKHKDEVEGTLSTSAPPVPDTLQVRPVRHEDGSIIPQDQHPARLDGQTSPVLRAPRPNPDKMELDVPHRPTEGSVLKEYARPTSGSVRTLQMVRIDDGPAPVHKSRGEVELPVSVPATSNAVQDFLLPTESSKVNSEGLGGRRSRSRACDECRKSKRRCIHDEDGNIDPIKAAETAIPRALGLAKKRHLSDSIQSPRRKRQRKASDAVRPVDATITQTSASAPSGIVPIELDTPAPEKQAESDTSLEIVQDVENLTHTAPEDATAQLQQEMLITSLTPGTVQDTNEPPTTTTTESHPEPPVPDQADAADDEIQLITTSPTPKMKLETDLVTTTLHRNDAVHDQPFSALVSPPDSSLTDVETSPLPILSNPPSTSPSRRSSEHDQRKQPPRYTPESGTVTTRARSSTHSASVNDRRDSTSSGHSQQVAPPLIGEGLISSTKEKTKRSGRARTSWGEASTDADGESLRLIRELAARDLGLRRRGGDKAL